jgi:hypothetical protein
MFYLSRTMFPCARDRRELSLAKIFARRASAFAFTSEVGVDVEAGNAAGVDVGVADDDFAAAAGVAGGDDDMNEWSTKSKEQLLLSSKQKKVQKTTQVQTGNFKNDHDDDNDVRTGPHWFGLWAFEENFDGVW